MYASKKEMKSRYFIVQTVIVAADIALQVLLSKNKKKILFAKKTKTKQIKNFSNKLNKKVK